MITDFGLEAQKSTEPLAFFNGYNRITLGFNFLAVGTGSTAPATTQVALVNEVARSSSNGGFNESETITVHTATNRVIVSGNLVRVINFNASFNLTEFGFFTSSSGNNCVYRQLFRTDPNNPNSDPTVVSVQSGDQLRVSYTVSWVVPLGRHLTKTITIGGTTYTVNIGLMVSSSGSTSISILLRAIHPFNDPSNAVITFVTEDINANPTTAIRSEPPITGTTTRMVHGSGDYRVVKSVQLSTAQANGTFKSIAIAAERLNFNLQAGIYFSFTPPITKTNLQTLTLSYTLSWGRA